MIAFNLAVLPDKVKPMAEALEVDTAGLGRAETIAACADSIRSFKAISASRPASPAAARPEMAERAVPGLYAGIAAQSYDPATARATPSSPARPPAR